MKLTNEQIESILKADVIRDGYFSVIKCPVTGIKFRFEGTVISNGFVLQFVERVSKTLLNNIKTVSKIDDNMYTYFISLKNDSDLVYFDKYLEFKTKTEMYKKLVLKNFIKKENEAYKTVVRELIEETYTDCESDIMKESDVEDLQDYLTELYNEFMDLKSKDVDTLITYIRKQCYDLAENDRAMIVSFYNNTDCITDFEILDYMTFLLECKFKTIIKDYNFSLMSNNYWRYLTEVKYKGATATR